MIRRHAKPADAALRRPHEAHNGFVMAVIEGQPLLWRGSGEHILPAMKRNSIQQKMDSAYRPFPKTKWSVAGICYAATGFDNSSQQI